MLAPCWPTTLDGRRPSRERGKVRLTWELLRRFRVIYVLVNVAVRDDSESGMRQVPAARPVLGKVVRPHRARVGGVRSAEAVEMLLERILTCPTAMDTH